MNLQHGKLEVKGCNTPKEEENELRKIAKRKAKEHRKYEKENEFVRVPILHGYKLVEKSKYEQQNGKRKN